MRPGKALLALLLVTSPLPAQRVTHRWSFNDTGSAANGTPIPDSIAGTPAHLRGVGAVRTGTAVRLPGTTDGNQPPSAISAYVDLPNGLLSSRSELTLEIWATIHSNQTWQRLFDFGRMNIAGDGLGAPGEITGSGSFDPAGTNARDQFILSVSRNGSLGLQRFSARLAGGSEETADSSLSTSLNTPYHYVAVFEPGVGADADTGGQMRLYRNGALVGTEDIPFRLSELEDVNNWLGRSQWSNDRNADISYDELRFYDHALSAAEITASRDAGPDAAIPLVLPPYSATLLHGGKVRVDVVGSASGEIVPSTVAIETPPGSGDATVNPDGSILYTHTSGTPAGDSFVYKAANTAGQFTMATATLGFDGDLRFANPHLKVPADPPSTGLALVDALPGLTFSEPLCLASPPGESERLFVCEKGGVIRVVPDVGAASPSAPVFLDLAALLASRGEAISATWEMGLLGLAFHPDYATNRQFFVFYSVDIDGGSLQNGDLHQRVSRFTAQAGNPNAADPGSELVLIEQADDFGNHNGGDLHFGPDGYLYVAVGDEGNGNDNPTFNSQLINKDLYAGILRIDVDKRPSNVEPHPHPSIPTDAGVARFSIPVDNPFVLPAEGGDWDGTYNGSVVTGTVRTEFWATGLRNPWRMSFDPLTGDLWCGDVGQGAREEIDLIVRGGNYGWVFREALLNGPRASQHPPIPANFDALYHDEPVYHYPRGGNFGGNSVTGGVVYRGSRIASLYGRYVFGDYGSGNIWAMDLDGSNVERIAGEGGIASFGYDPSNQDVLLADIGDGRIWRLESSSASDPDFPATLTETGLFAELPGLSPSPGLVPYEVNLPFWSDHAIKRRWFVVPDGTSTFNWSAEDPWTLPSGTVWVKHFDLELERGNPSTRKRIETRLLVKNDAGAYGVSYRWNDEGTEAFLVGNTGEDFDLEVTEDGSPVTQTWRIPSRAECLICHTGPAGRALSFNTRQLNLEHDMLGFDGNQLDTLASQGFFANPPSEPGLMPRHLRPDETDHSVEGRVRSYLAVNCGYCHMDGGTAGGAAWDGRAFLTLDETGLVDGAVNNNQGDPLNRLVVPGDPLHSVVLQRVGASNGFSRMPPLATNELDQGAIDLLTEWISTTLPAQQDYAAWRLAQFGSGSSAEGEPGEDPDFDGQTNECEFLQGTLPLDRSSRFAPQVDADDEVRLSFSLPENRSFRVLTSTDLSTWTPWQVPGNQRLPVAGGLIELVGPLDSDRRFFSLEISGN